jgi:para-aminobenzoate synthetase component I
LLINKEFEQKLNSLGKTRQPFFFAIDFEGKEFLIDDSKVLFCLDEKTNVKQKVSRKTLHVKKKPIDFIVYKQAFDKVISEIKKGNTYLLNS